MQNQINTTPITQFIQSLKAAELSQLKEVKIPIQQARLLNLALAEILEKMNRDWETLYHALKQASDPEVVSVSMDGGGFEENKS
jgi:hypothetical protein